MRADTIPMDLAFAVSFILAFQGYTLFTAPQSAVELAIQKAIECRSQQS